MMNAKLKSSWPEAVSASSKRAKSRRYLVHQFRLSGDVVTRSKAQDKQDEKLSKAQAILAEARRKVKQEREDKEKLKAALARKPLGVKMRVDKNGNYYYQERKDNGGFGKRVNLNK